MLRRRVRCFVTLAVESATTELSSEVASSTTIRLGERFLLGSRMAVAASFFLKVSQGRTIMELLFSHVHKYYLPWSLSLSM